MDTTANLRLPYIAPSQAQKHVPYNEAMRMLDAIAQTGVLDRDLTSPPPTPADGDRYIVAVGAGGDWTGHDHALAAWQDGDWAFYDPQPGWLIWIADENTLIVWDGAAWVQASAGGAGGVTPTSLGDGSHGLVGVNGAVADTTNRLSVRTPSVLFDAVDAAESGTGDCRVVVNKEAAGDTASQLFQTGFSGRAEFGLTGDDDFHLKVSANGSSWSEAIIIDKDTGFIGVGGAPATPFHCHAGASNVAFRLEGTDPTVVFQMLDDTTTATGNGPIAFLRTGDNLQFYTAGSARLTINGSGNVGVGISSPGSRLHVYGGGVQVGNPTGGDKGAGSINAQAVYDDNTLLSCYVFDQALDGGVEIDKWDQKVPDRIVPIQTTFDQKTGQEVKVEPERRVARKHDPLRKFAGRVGSAHDPLTLDGYARHWREKRHLTSMPNEAAFDPADGQLTTGEWIQRLVETVEIQAVLIEQLNERTKGRAVA